MRRSFVALATLTFTLYANTAFAVHKLFMLRSKYLRFFPRSLALKPSPHFPIFSVVSS